MNVELRCDRCGRATTAEAPAGWRCDCGGSWELPAGPPFDPASIDTAGSGIWRYRNQLRTPAKAIPVSLGEGSCPWVRLRDGTSVACAYLQPTGSFKDLGAATLVTWASTAATPPLIEDSSGNAGGALAAYAACAGVPCRIYVPARAPAGKLRVLDALGAEVVRVDGPRERATEAALADTSGTYCSHAWNPFFLEGIKTLAFGWWEQRGGAVPERIVVPAGQGSLILGLFSGFRELQVGTGSPLPALIAVQHESIAPLHTAWHEWTRPQYETATTPVLLADGIAIAAPVRERAVLRAVRESGGTVLVVDDAAIRGAMAELAANGLWVEPTGAVSLAGYRKLTDESGGDAGIGDRSFGDDASPPARGDVVVLTGHGLKAT